MREKEKLYKALSSRVGEIMNVEQARKELRDARNDVTWLWLKKKQNINKKMS